MDANTRYALAVHLSPNRDNRAAVAVMRKAMAAADAPPRSITTDKLGSYTSAIERVFPDADHIQSEGIRARVNSNLSERLQGTIRDREKTLRALDGLESGQRYFDGWAVNYNVMREHEGIKFQTPNEMAGVNPPFTEWADVVRVAATDTGKQDTKTQTLAEVADRAERPGPDTAPPTTHFVPDPTRRLRPKGETDTDDPDEEWPPTPATVERWRADGDADIPIPSGPRNTGMERMHARPVPVSGGGSVIRVRQSKRRGKAVKPRKGRTGKHDSLQKALSKRGRARSR